MNVPEVVLSQRVDGGALDEQTALIALDENAVIPDPAE